MHKGRTERAALCAGTALCDAEPRWIWEMLLVSHLDHLILLKAALPKVPGRLAQSCPSWHAVVSQLCHHTRQG